MRTKLATQQIAANAAQLASISAPSVGTRIVAVFRGVDRANEPIVAVGAIPYSPR